MVMVRRRTKTERMEMVESARIEVEEAVRMKVERWAASEAAGVSMEMQAAMKEACIVSDVLRLRQKVKPQRIRLHKSR